jgi:hypothetical protein
MYIRHYAHGMVLVNPTTSTRTINLFNTHYRAVPSGGGGVPPSGAAPGSLSYMPVTSITLEPHQAAIVLDQAP